MVAHFAFAQTEMRWDAHGLGFTVPNNFKIETKQEDEFSASNDNLFLTLLDTQSSTNLLMTIVFTEGNQAKARKLANSFFAYD